MCRKALAMIVATQLIAGAAAAQSSQGPFTSYTTAIDTTVLDDGIVQIVQHYRQTTMAQDPSFPLHNIISDCIGLFRISRTGVPETAHGSCFSRDVDGHGSSFWWRMEEAGTATCETLCGVWGMYGGYGRFANLSADGTWVQEIDFGDGSIGTWTGMIRQP